MKTLFSFFHALSPLHAGIGQGIGTIDLPIAREKATNIPFVPGSSLKGVLRDRCKEPEVQRALFGPDVSQNPSEFSGSVYFSDLTLLCMPIRSLQRVFAWVTSPYILRRLQRDLASHPGIKGLKVPKVKDESEALVATEGLLHQRKAYLEELDLTGTVHPEASQWAQELGKLLFPEDSAWQNAFKEQFCICHDNVFSFFVEHGTQVTARIRLEEKTKTVAQGGLWYEESLPVETILWGLVQVEAPKGGNLEIDSVFEIGKLVDRPIQIGGKATVGRGLGWLKLHGGK